MTKKKICIVNDDDSIRVPSMNIMLSIFITSKNWLVVYHIAANIHLILKTSRLPP